MFNKAGDLVMFFEFAFVIGFGQCDSYLGMVVFFDSVAPASLDINFSGNFSTSNRQRCYCYERKFPYIKPYDPTGLSQL